MKVLKPASLVIADKKLQPDMQPEIIRVRDGQPELYRTIVGCGDVPDGDRGGANRWKVRGSALRRVQFGGTDENAAVPVDTTHRIDVAGRELKGNDLIGRADAEFREPPGDRAHAGPLGASVIRLGIRPSGKDLHCLGRRFGPVRQRLRRPAASCRQPRAADSPEHLPAVQGRRRGRGVGFVRHAGSLAMVGPGASIALERGALTAQCLRGHDPDAVLLYYGYNIKSVAPAGDQASRR